MISNYNVLPSQCIADVSLCTFAIILIKINIVTSHPVTFTGKELQILKDLPGQIDFETYLSALENLVKFVDANRLFIDLNLSFGIYLINVMLRSTVKSRGHLLPLEDQKRLVYVVKTNEEIVEYIFKSNQLPNHLSALLQLMVKPYKTKIFWPTITQKLDMTLSKKLKLYAGQKVENIYGNWTNYKRIVYSHSKKRTPSANESDYCLHKVALNAINLNGAMMPCRLPYNCIKMAINGTDSGFQISHRLLFFLIAHYWRGCVVTTSYNDIEIMNDLCTKMYYEVNYIANHNFALVTDIAMEDISLCALKGHAQFLQRTWINEQLNFQTKMGCFNLVTPKVRLRRPSVEFVARGNTTWKGLCHPHATATGGTMLAAAIRFIMENYF